MKISNNKDQNDFNKLKNKIFIKNDLEYKIVGLGESFYKERFFILQNINDQYGWGIDSFTEMIKRMKRKIILINTDLDGRYLICFCNMFNKCYKEVI